MTSMRPSFCPVSVRGVRKHNVEGWVRLDSQCGGVGKIDMPVNHHLKSRNKHCSHSSHSFTWNLETGMESFFGVYFVYILYIYDSRQIPPDRSATQEVLRKLFAAGGFNLFH